MVSIFSEGKASDRFQCSQYTNKICIGGLIALLNNLLLNILLGFPGGSDSKKFACSAGDPALIPGSGRSPEEGLGYPLQHSCLENSTDRGAWQATAHGVAKSWKRLKQLSKHAARQISD